MTEYVISQNDLTITAIAGALSTYEFGSCVAKHHFCNRCGIYPFHQTLRKPGDYRVNIGCLEGIDSTALPYQVFDGASL